MSSTERDSSIASSSIFIPGWVKKFDNSGFDPSALSPPTHDGEFFYVKLPKSEKVDLPQYKRTNEVVAQKEQTLINHTSSRKEFIPIIKDSVPTVKPKIIRPMALDDGFKSDNSSFGTSVVAVAQEMITGSSKPSLRGLTTDDTNDTPSNNYLNKRRNSKSLPASPLVTPTTSPRTRRKNVGSFALHNKLNLSAIGASLNESEENIEKKSGSSWILSGLFSHLEKGGLTKSQDDLVAPSERTGFAVNEEPGEISSKANVNLKMEVKSSDVEAPPTSDRKVYLNKRSEIRKLNFISPVSM